jgi:hypothetical protein
VETNAVETSPPEAIGAGCSSAATKYLPTGNPDRRNSPRSFVCLILPQLYGNDSNDPNDSNDSNDSND